MAWPLFNRLAKEYMMNRFDFILLAAIVVVVGLAMVSPVAPSGEMFFYQ